MVAGADGARERDPDVIVLGLDTATVGAGAALVTGDRTLTRPIAWRASFRESVPAMRGLLDDAGHSWSDVDALAIVAGPGSFTGLRIAASLALGLCSLTDVELHAVPTLAAVAEACAAGDADRVCASLDARRGRRYVAVYARDPRGWTHESGPFDIPPEETDRLAGGAPVVGPDTSGRVGPGAIAVALARLVSRDSLRYRLEAPGRLELVYARPAVEGP